MHGVLLPMRRWYCLKEKKASFPSQTEYGQTLVLCYHVVNCASLQRGSLSRSVGRSLMQGLVLIETIESTSWSAAFIGIKSYNKKAQHEHACHAGVANHVDMIRQPTCYRRPNQKVAKVELHMWSACTKCHNSEHTPLEREQSSTSPKRNAHFARENTSKGAQQT